MKESISIYYLTLPNGICPVKMFIESLLAKQQAKLTRILVMIEQYGNIVLRQHTKKLIGQQGLWELRLLGKDNIRVIFTFIGTSNILLISGFIKKQMKTPQKELIRAHHLLVDFLNSVDK